MYHSQSIQKLKMTGWLVFGAIVGWIASFCLWQSKYLDPSSDYPGMLSIVVGCMVVAALYGARKHVEVYPKLIVYPLLLSGLAWFTRPMSDCSPAQRYLRQVDDMLFVYTMIIIPAGVIGGITAIVFTRLRQDSQLPVHGVSELDKKDECGL
jgi:hypothetical protein